MKKTTIELPDQLYRRAKVLAVQEGKTFRALVVDALESELARASAGGEPTERYWASRRLLPEFERFRRQGAYARGNDSTEALSEDRDHG